MLACRNDELAAYRSVDDEAALVRADAVDQLIDSGFDLGPFMGIPISAKDLYGVPGFPTYAGSPRRLPFEFECAGPVVEALRRQMAIVVGKTNTVEFAYGGLGTNIHTASPKNPHDRQRVAGGSSSGAGVSVSERSAMLALGTDTAGSIRVPASFTGNFGFKPTKGRWSTDGIVPLSPTLDTPGIIVPTASDLRTAFVEIDPQWESLAHFIAEGPRPDVRALRIGRTDSFFWDDCSPGVLEAVDDALSVLVRHGTHLEALEIPELQSTFDLFLQGGPVPAELSYFLGRELPDWIETLDPNVRSRIKDGDAMPAVEYFRRIDLMKANARAVHGRTKDIDVLVAPTVACSPPTFDMVDSPAGYRRWNLLALRNTSVVNYLGLCAVTIPVGVDAVGMPVGLMLIAWGGRDELLVALAREIAMLLNR